MFCSLADYLSPSVVLTAGMIGVTNSQARPSVDIARRQLVTGEPIRHWAKPDSTNVSDDLER